MTRGPEAGEESNTSTKGGKRWETRVETMWPRPEQGSSLWYKWQPQGTHCLGGTQWQTPVILAEEEIGRLANLRPACSIRGVPDHPGPQTVAQKQNTHKKSVLEQDYEKRALKILQKARSRKQIPSAQPAARPRHYGWLLPIKEVGLWEQEWLEPSRQSVLLLNYNTGPCFVCLLVFFKKQKLSSCKSGWPWLNTVYSPSSTWNYEPPASTSQVPGSQVCQEAPLSI